MMMIIIIHGYDEYDDDDELHFPAHLPEESIVDKLKMHEIDNNEDHNRHHHQCYQLSRHCSHQ